MNFPVLSQGFPLRGFIPGAGSASSQSCLPKHPHPFPEVYLSFPTLPPLPWQREAS